MSFNSPAHVIVGREGLIFVWIAAAIHLGRLPQVQQKSSAPQIEVLEDQRRQPGQILEFGGSVRQLPTLKSVQPFAVPPPSSSWVDPTFTQGRNKRC
ncbi:hypothetical protein [Pseudomonas piscis]